MTIRVVGSGQSNFRGGAGATGGPDWSGISSDVRVWNNVNPLGALGTAFVSAAAAQAAGTFEFSDQNSFSPWFCDKLARTIYDDVDLTVIMRGGSPIELWDPSEATYPLLQQCIDVWAATGQDPAHIFLWHQGEGNMGEPDGYYEGRFLALLDDLEAGGVIDQDTLVIVGQLDGSTFNRVDFNQRILGNLSRNRRIVTASSYSLPTYDGTHFTADALTALGAKRYYSAYRFAELKAGV